MSMPNLNGGSYQRTQLNNTGHPQVLDSHDLKWILKNRAAQYAFNCAFNLLCWLLLKENKCLMLATDVAETPELINRTFCQIVHVHNREQSMCAIKLNNYKCCIQHLVSYLQSLNSHLKSLLQFTYYITERISNGCVLVFTICSLGCSPGLRLQDSGRCLCSKMSGFLDSKR